MEGYFKTGRERNYYYDIESNNFWYVEVFQDGHEADEGQVLFDGGPARFKSFEEFQQEVLRLEGTCIRSS